MEKLGCLTDVERIKFYGSRRSDTEKAMMIGNATALYLRFKSIEYIEINFLNGCYDIYFKEFCITIKYTDSIEELYQRVEKDIIEKAVDGTL